MLLSWSSSLSTHAPTLVLLRLKPPSSSISSRSLPITSLHATGFQFHDFSQLAQNKVLVAATLASAVGQFSKPFTSALLYRDNLHFQSLSRAGGFPSVHTAGVVAGATSIGLERGLSDSVFGMSVIFAAIVMYDAQAVRWEVGQHAKLLNKIVVVKTKNQSHTPDSPANSNIQPSKSNSEAPVPLLSASEQTRSCMVNSDNPPLYLTSENTSGAVTSNLGSNSDPVLKGTNNFVPLEESIGHTPVEVAGGAFLGFLSSLVIYSVL